MRDISEIDKNLKIETNIKREGLVFFDSKNEPFTIHGLLCDGGPFLRLPKEVAERVSDTVLDLSGCTAGGRVRFVTDSPYVVIKAVQPMRGAFGHMAPTGQSGFDLYVGNTYFKTFVTPGVRNTAGYESAVDFPDSSVRTITINFPLYYNVDELYIGLKEGSMLEKAPDYTVKAPMVFYGSSITQGGCASRAGTSYQGFISRALDADYINLGFSGSAWGEREMAEYIAGLDMSVFVLDYDHNAHSVAHLKETHETFFKIVREANPDLPIVLVSRPKIDLSPDEMKRREVIIETYENALAANDKNVYFIDGRELMAIAGNEGTVDGVHPTDLGFFSMAQRMIETLKDIV